MGRSYTGWIVSGSHWSQIIAVRHPGGQSDGAAGRVPGQAETTETSPQHDRCLMTRAPATGYLWIVMKGLQHTNAFVIQFRRSTDLHPERLSGRIEHVASGHTATFESIEELPQVLQKMLKSVSSEDASGVE